MIGIQGIDGCQWWMLCAVDFLQTPADLTSGEP